MKKYNMRHYETLLDELFPQEFPTGETGGETLANEQPTLDEIWEWLGNTDAE